MMTDDPVEEGFLGCAGVAQIKGLQDKLIRLARGGFKHHTSVGKGRMKAVLEEAFTTYLGYDLVRIDE
jgi:cobalamin biosynthesis protein CbiD